MSHPQIKNLLFITADQFRGDCLSCLGHDTVKTPRLDELAQDGALFAHHYSQSAPCGPSRATLHSGTPVSFHRSVMNGVPIRRGISGWPQQLRHKGLDPALIGYTHTALPDDSEERNFEGIFPGLRLLVDTRLDNRSWAEWVQRREPAAGTGVSDLLAPPNPLGLRNNLLSGRARYGAQLSDTAFLTEEAMSFIREQKNKRWVLHLSYFRPHDPYVAPAPFDAMYESADLAFTRADREHALYTHPWFERIAPKHRFGADLDETVEQARRRYFGLISELDGHLGALFDFLRERNDYDETLIIFTSDHGEQLGDHWLLGKLGFFRQSMHVPLIVRDPRSRTDVTRGKRIDAMTEHVDIASTIVDFMGATPAATFAGRSLRPLLEAASPPADWRTSSHWEYAFPSAPNGSPEPYDRLATRLTTSHKLVLFDKLPPIAFDYGRDGYDECINRAEDQQFQRPLERFAEFAHNWLHGERDNA